MRELSATTLCQWSSAFGLSFLLASCNVLTGNSENTDSNFHPGIPTTTGTNPSGPAPTLTLTSVLPTATDDSAAAFGAGVSTGVAWDTVNHVVKLGSGGGCDGSTTNCGELSASWTPEWSSLVSYYKFNGDWSDSKGSNNGTASGTASLGGPSKLGTGASFDGQTGSTSAGTTGFPTGNSERSFSMWINPSSLPSLGIYNCIFSYGIAGNETAQWVCLNNTAGVQSIGVGGYNDDFIVPYTFPTNTWTFLTVTYDGTNLSIYVNGAFLASTSKPLWNTGSGNFVIGNAAWGSYYSKFGLDDLAIWSKALSPTEIQTIYSRQQPVTGRFGGMLVSRVLDAGSLTPWSNFSWLSTLPFYKELSDANQSESSADYSALVGSDGTTNTHDLMSGNVGLWHLNEAFGAGTVSDSSGAGNNATVQGGVTLSSAGKLQTSALLNGSSGYFSVSNPVNLNSLTSVTLSAWANPTLAPGVSNCIVTGGGHANRNFQMCLENTYPGGTTGLEWYSVATGEAWSSVVSNTLISGWHHYVETYSAGTVSFYIDGQFINATSGLPALNAGGPGLEIGLDTYSSYFTGSLDEVAIWNRSLAASEVKEIYQRGASRLKFQVRSCALIDCSDGTWKGTDGSNQTYFTELNNNSLPLMSSGSVLASLPNLLFSSFTSPPSPTSYFQYRAIFEADDANATLGPQLKNVEVKTSATHVLPSYMATGTCSEAGVTVSVTVSDGTHSASGSGLCTAGVFSAIVDVTGFDDGTLTIGASSTAHGATGTATGTYTGSNTALPANATALAWIEGASTTNFIINAAWTPSTSSDLKNQTIQFYTGSCARLIGGAINLGSATIATRAFTGLNGNSYSYKITSLDSGGNSQTSPCSSVITETTLLTDNSNSSTSPSFAGGSQGGTSSSTNELVLNTTTNNAELESSWTPQWSHLVEYWKFNGTVGSIASGATIPATVGTSGTANSVSALAYSQGHLNQGMSFLPDHDDLRVATAAPVSSAYSVSLWINITSFGTYVSAPVSATTSGTLVWELVFSKTYTGDGQAGNYEIGMYSTGSGSGQSSSSAPNSFGAAQLGSWHHVVVTYDSSAATKTIFYLDGTQLAGDLSGISGNFPPIDTLWIGGLRGDAINCCSTTGSIDDLAIWNSALTASEIQTIYSRQSAIYAGIFTSRIMNYGAADAWASLKWLTTLPFGKELPDAVSGVPQSESSSDYSSLTANLMTGNIGLWHFDEAAPTTGVNNDFKDSSGEGNFGEASGGVTFATPGEFGKSVTFDGISGQIATSDIVFSATDEFSISFWMKPEFVNLQWETAIRFPDNNTSIYVQRTASTSGSNLYWEGTTNLYFTTTPIEWGRWYHVVAQRHSGHLEVYVNGIKDLDTPSDSRVFTFRGLGYSGAGSEYFKGSLDEVSIWSRALADAEVIDLYRRGANRVKFQVRSCTAGDCSDNLEWLGPDNSNQSYFSELHNNSAFKLGGNNLFGDVLASAPDMMFQYFSGLLLPTRQYFQYRAILESDDTGIGCGGSWCSPELKSVSVSP